MVCWAKALFNIYPIFGVFPSNILVFEGPRSIFEKNYPLLTMVEEFFTGMLSPLVIFLFFKYNIMLLFGDFRIGKLALFHFLCIAITLCN